MTLNLNKDELERVLRGLHYYCIRWNPREHAPEYVDVMSAFDGYEMYDAIVTYKSVKDYAELDRWVRLVFRMKFHLKTEAEYNICGIVSPNEDDLTKLDVYDQLVPNISFFVDLLNKKCGLNFPKMETKKENMIVSFAEEM